MKTKQKISEIYFKNPNEYEIKYLISEFNNNLDFVELDIHESYGSGWTVKAVEKSLDYSKLKQNPLDNVARLTKEIEKEIASNYLDLLTYQKDAEYVKGYGNYEIMYSFELEDIIKELENIKDWLLSPENIIDTKAFEILTSQEFVNYVEHNGFTLKDLQEFKSFASLEAAIKEVKQIKAFENIKGKGEDFFYDLCHEVFSNQKEFIAKLEWRDIVTLNNGINKLDLSSESGKRACLDLQSIRDQAIQNLKSKERSKVSISKDGFKQLPRYKENLEL